MPCPLMPNLVKAIYNVQTYVAGEIFMIRTAAIALYVVCASAQTTSSTIAGLVKDTSGAVVPAAAVAIVNTESGVTSSTLT